MFRLWIKEWKDNRLVKDMVVTDDTTDTRTHKILNSLEKACYELDLSKPIWLESNQKEFLRRNRTRFSKDNFVEAISFDYLEIQIIEE